MQNLGWSQPLSYDSMSTMLHLWHNITDIMHHAYDDQYLDTTTLPSELKFLSNDSGIIDTSDSAFVEITAACAHMKYGLERLMINMNYRNGINNISGLVKLLHHGTNLSRVALIAFNSTDHFWGL
jgi:hypothetical protein